MDYVEFASIVRCTTYKKDLLKWIRKVQDQCQVPLRAVFTWDEAINYIAQLRGQKPCLYREPVPISKCTPAPEVNGNPSSETNGEYNASNAASSRSADATVSDFAI